MKNETTQIENTATVLIRKIRDAILDDVFKPGDWLPEMDLAKRFEVSRSPIREALQALEKEGTVISEPYKGAVIKPLSPEEALDIAELRLAIVTLAAKEPYLRPRTRYGHAISFVTLKFSFAEFPLGGPVQDFSKVSTSIAVPA